MIWIVLFCLFAICLGRLFVITDFNGGAEIPIQLDESQTEGADETFIVTLTKAKHSGSSMLQIVTTLILERFDNTTFYDSLRFTRSETSEYRSCIQIAHNSSYQSSDMWARVKSNHLAADDTSARVQPASSVMVQTDNRHCVTAFDELMQLLSPTSPPAMSLLVRSVHEWKYLESWLHIDRGNPDFTKVLLTDYYVYAPIGSHINDNQIFSLSAADDDRLVVIDKLPYAAHCRRREFMPPTQLDTALDGATMKCNELPTHFARIVTRDIVGDGMHASLRTTFALLSHKAVEQCLSVSIAVLEVLPNSVYVDAYEVSQLEAFNTERPRLQLSEPLDLEAPSYSNRARAFAPLLTRTLRQNETAALLRHGVFYVAFDLPLHARYQAPSTTSSATHRNVTIEPPLVFVQCVTGDTHAASLVWKRAVVSHTSQLSWPIPVGDPGEARTVTNVTALFIALGCVAVVGALCTRRRGKHQPQQQSNAKTTTKLETKKDESTSTATTTTTTPKVRLATSPRASTTTTTTAAKRNNNSAAEPKKTK